LDRRLGRVDLELHADVLIQVLRDAGIFSAGRPLWRRPISTFAQLRG